MDDVVDWLNKNSGAVQAIATGILVVVTAVYVVLTRSISRNATRQADASVKMAEEMREQTMSMSRQTEALEDQTTEARIARSLQIRPVVTVVRRQSCTADKELRRSVCRELTVTVQNVGKGNASNGIARVEWQGWPFTEHKDWSLAPHEDRRFTFARQEGEPQETTEGEPCIVLEYDDMDGVRWRSGRNLRVENDTGSCDLAEEFGPKEVPHD